MHFAVGYPSNLQNLSSHQSIITTTIMKAVTTGIVLVLPTLAACFSVQLFPSRTTVFPYASSSSCTSRLTSVVSTRGGDDTDNNNNNNNNRSNPLAQANIRSTLFSAALVVAATVAAATPALAVSGGGLDFAGLDISGQDFSNQNYKGKDFTQGR